MVHKPVVFISSTSDLRSARDLVGKVLYSMGYEPIWQDIEATDGGELLEVLRKRLAPCAMLIQLVGQRYGAEPPTPTPEFGRVSYTQFEALYAGRLGRKLIYHFIDEAFPTEAAAPESSDRHALQSAYRQQIKDLNKLRQSNIATAQDLELSIRRVTDELATVRKQGDRRFRRLLWLAGGAAAGVAIVTVMVWMMIYRQARTAERADHQSSQVKDELAALRKEVGKAIGPKELAQGQTAPEPLSPDLIAKAKVLLARGNAEDQALANIALRQHEDANRIIQELKANPGNPIDEAVRLLTLEGDNWYQAGLPDKAIEPYEQVLALRPKDYGARNNALLIRCRATLGDLAAHRRRAIEIGDDTLKLFAPGSVEWAMTQNQLGVAWTSMPTGDTAENLRNAIAAYEAAAAVLTKEKSPVKWAAVQNNLGIAWSRMPGDQGQNLSKAITAYDNALAVLTKEDELTWASAQYNLALVLSELPTGDRAENLNKAIVAYVAAVTIFPKDADPGFWATMQTHLADAWKRKLAGDHSQNLRNAIDAYNAALTVRTEAADPAGWALIQHRIGGIWIEMPTGDREQNLRKAIDAYQAALKFRTKQANPDGYAATQRKLGSAWSKMPAGDRSQNLRNAILAFEAALPILAKDQDPAAWAGTCTNLSWCQIRLKDFKGALATAEGAADLSPPYLPLETNWAHALLFLGRTDEAKSLYLKHVGEKIGGQTWQEVIVGDFDKLEREGLTHPQFQILRELLSK